MRPAALLKRGMRGYAMTTHYTGLVTWRTCPSATTLSTVCSPLLLREEGVGEEARASLSMSTEPTCFGSACGGKW